MKNMSLNKHHRLLLPFAKCFSCKKSLFLFLNVFLILACISYYHKDNSFIERWEESLTADFDDCVEILQDVLDDSILDEGLLSSKVFSWSTPKFSDLILQHTDNAAKKNLMAAATQVCSQLKIKINKEDSVDISSVNSNQVSLASPEYTTFVVLNKKPIVVGDDILLQIQAKDYEGKSTATGGGDFFKIRAEDPINRLSVAASSITEIGKGIYNANIKTFWVGRHDIKIFFGQSGHFVDLLKRYTSRHYALDSKFYGEFVKNSGRSNSLRSSKRERTLCNINLKIFNEDSKVCNYSQAAGEDWFCLQPSSDFVCNDLYSVYSKRKQNSLDFFSLFPPHDRGTLKRTTLKGEISSITTQLPKDKLTPKKLPKCLPNLKTPSPSGYWEKGFWKSKVCDTYPFSTFPKEKEKCLRNKEFYFIGDSTARQWYEFFVETSSIDKLLLKENSFYAKEIKYFTDVWEPRTAVIERLGTTFHYRSQGQPLQNGGLYNATHFISVQLDEMPVYPDQGSNLTVVIATGPHFFLYNPDIYLRRILATRDAALRFLSRNPKALIIFKGTNTFIRGIGIGECCLSDWISFRQHKLAKHVFDGTPIIYLDVWDMTVSHNSEDLVHPVAEVIQNEIDMALSFRCQRN